MSSKRKHRQYAPLTSQVAIVVNNLTANAEDIRDVGLVPGSGRSLVGGHGNSLQYSCLENLMDREAWQAVAYRVAKSWAWLKWLSMQACSLTLTLAILFGMSPKAKETQTKISKCKNKNKLKQKCIKLKITRELSTKWKDHLLNERGYLLMIYLIRG